MTKGSQTASDFPLLSIMNGKRGLPANLIQKTVGFYSLNMVFIYWSRILYVHYPRYRLFTVFYIADKLLERLFQICRDMMGCLRLIGYPIIT